MLKISSSMFGEPQGPDKLLWQHKKAQLRHHLTSVSVTGFPSELKPGVNATNDLCNEHSNM